MIEATMHVDASATAEAGDTPDHRGRTRTCVGCGARVDALGPEGADLIRLVLGPGGEIAVDGGSRRGGGMGRGAHVHARRACVERAARSGLLRATKGAARSVSMGGPDQGGNPGEEGDFPASAAALNTDSLARAIQRSMDRRIEGLLAAAVRTRQVARGADAVTGACHRGDAALIVVACDAAAAASLTEVRRAVAEGRAVAWGTKARLGTIVAPGAAQGKLAPPVFQTPTAPALSDAGETPAPPALPDVGVEVGVVAITSRHIAQALRQAVQSAASVLSSSEAAISRPAVRTGEPSHPPRSPQATKAPAKRVGAPRAPGPTGPRGTKKRARNHRSDG